MTTRSKRQTKWVLGAFGLSIALASLCMGGMSLAWEGIKEYVDTSIEANPALQRIEERLGEIACDVSWIKGLMEKDRGGES